ncbi:MAG: RidA family protein [Actinomycetota bacterium]
MSAEARLAELGIVLPEPPKPVATYVPFRLSEHTVYVSGQVPFVDGKLSREGIVGRDVTLDEAASDARICAINVLTQLKAAAGGSLDNVARMIKITVFVASAADFSSQSQVANGASDLFVAVFGDNGRHARSAVGVAALPLNSPVEVEAIAELQR